MKVKNAKTSTAPMRGPDIEGLLNCPGISPNQLLASKVMPLSRAGIYAALDKGDIESFRIGKKIIIPTAPLRKKLGMQAP